MTQQERAAWGAAYRIFDEFAPGLRAAAAQDDTEKTDRLFRDVYNKTMAEYNNADAGGRLIMIGLYGILEDVFKEARDTAQAAAGVP